MSIAYNKIQVSVDLDALVHNFALLNERGGSVIPVVKSDAYGHGLKRTARALAEAGADAFAVGTVEEGAYLRGTGCSGTIISLLGPIDGWEYAECQASAVQPFIGNFEQLEGMARTARASGSRLEIILKFDTGMARLGFREPDLPRLVEILGKNPGLKVVMASSHLATADEPNQFEFVREQNEAFAAILKKLAEMGVHAPASLANSAGILAHAQALHQRQRAGIALYGVNPFLGTPWEEKGRGFKPAMEATAPVLDVHALPKGRTISYGRTFKAEKDMRVAVVAAGYADAYSRSLSNAGQMLVQGKRARILGRVCMQLTAVDVSDMDPPEVGDRVHLLGGEGPEAISPEELAGWWNTIPYEVFCLLGLNRRACIGGGAAMDKGETS